MTEFVRVEITPVSNGYSVVAFTSDTGREIPSNYAFETYASLVFWLAEALPNRRDVVGKKCVCGRPLNDGHEHPEFRPHAAALTS